MVGFFGYKEIWEEYLKLVIDINGIVVRVGIIEFLFC